MNTPEEPLGAKLTRRSVDALYDARNAGKVMDEAAADVMNAVLAELAKAAPDRLRGRIEQIDDYDIDVILEAVLGIPVPDHDEPSPDESDIADLRYDEDRAAAKDEG